MLLLTHSHLNLQLLFDAVLLMSLYLAYKLYKCFSKRQREKEKLKRVAKKPKVSREDCIGNMLFFFNSCTRYLFSSYFLLFFICFILFHLFHFLFLFLFILFYFIF